MSDALEELRMQLAQDPGFLLFTVLSWQPDRGVLRRVATDHPAEFPLGAEKSLEVSGEWMQAVVNERRSFLGATDAEVAQVFSDIAPIRSLGCGSVVNAPITTSGDVVGVLAILAASGTYDAASVATVEKVVADLAPRLAASVASQMPS